MYNFSREKSLFCMAYKSEYQVSVLGGLFSISGSGHYLKDMKTSARTVKSSLLYNIKTKEESVNIYHKDLKEAFALEAIETGMATHVVVGISWGANTILSCEYRNNDNKEVMEIQGSLSAKLQSMSVGISGKVDVDFSEGESNKDLKFEIHLYGDILPNDEDLPTTFEDALALMKQTPSLVAKSNEGRGKPLSYTLLPLSLLQEYLQFECLADSMIKSIEEDCLCRVVKLFDRLSTVQQVLNDLYNDANESRFCVKREDLVEIAETKDTFEIQETKFRSDLATALTEIRSGEGDVSQLEDLMAEFISSLKTVDELQSQWGHISTKVRFAQALISNGAKYIGFGQSFEEEIMRYFDSTTVILFFQEEAKTSDKSSWKENRQLFMEELKKNKSEHIYFVVDCDIHKELWPKKGPSIQVMKNSEIVTENLLKDRRAIANKAFAQCTVEMTRSTKKPKDRVNLTIACSGRNCKPGVKYEWMCPKCDQNIEYGFEDKLYCACGNGPLLLFEFKCTDIKHGSEFVLHDDTDYFMELIDQLWVIDIDFPDTDKNAHCDGHYALVSEKVDWAMDRPVYKHVNKDRYIFWKPIDGWSIGSIGFSETKGSFYSSEFFFRYFT